MNKKARYLALGALAFAALIYLLAWSPLLSVKSISTSGLPTSVSSEFLIKKSTITIGEQLARIEPNAVEKSLEEISWIRSASVSRHWISGEVSIELSTRIPVGLYKGKAIDATGALFEVPGRTPSGLPTVTASSPQLGLAAIKVFTSLPQDLRDSLISMSAANESSIVSWQQVRSHPVKVSWGTPEQLTLKVSVYRALLALPENKELRRIDLSAPHAPIVK
jgi:cell division protein FtsQ